jgi:preprotein translocase subunit SecE
LVRKRSRVQVPSSALYGYNSTIEWQSQKPQVTFYKKQILKYREIIMASLVGKIKKFSKEVNSEMKKVSWPTKEQLKESTGVVIVVCGLFVVFTFIVDEIVVRLLKLLF